MTDTRPSFQEIYLALAEQLARRSTCGRLQVGCVIMSTDYRYVYAVGYNGNAAGLKNGCDQDVPGSCFCLHAEENAVINCTVNRNADKIVFVTHSPCLMCAKRLINLGGVIAVHYRHAYRSDAGLALLATAGIMPVHHPEEPPPPEAP